MILSIRVKGAVQGVGYRPFIAKKASELGLLGRVKNIGAAVDIIVKGPEKTVRDFSDLLKNEYPAGAFILDVQISELDENSYSFDGFEITDSTTIDLKSELPVFLPDIGICDDCMKEMLDKNDRRYNYPLISCASCGPRLSIINSLPYDRDTTTMEAFNMCPECSAEYRSGRRRHAQTISCHSCGPQMLLKCFDDKGIIIYSGKETSVEKAIDILKNGGIIGLKGVSGYQLVTLPRQEQAKRLREIKGRESKPFAIMFSDVSGIREYCNINDSEEELLKSSARPIVLLTKKKEFPEEVIKGSRYIGAFLPSAGIHRLLTDGAGPLIVTSANISDEPIIISDEMFIETFMQGDKPKVDGVLYHHRKINMPQDDSVMYVQKKSDGNFSSKFIRRSRGFAPLPIIAGTNSCETEGVCHGILAMGGDLKNTFSFAKKDRVIMSQYIGDLSDYSTYLNYKELIKGYYELFEASFDEIVSDLHPGYFSVKYAREIANKAGKNIIQVQHHHAHALSVMAENSLKSCIGVSFDGTGYGTDGNIWGGEFLYCTGSEFKRCGQLSYVTLAGGDKASKDAALVKACYEHALGNEEISQLVSMALLNRINTFVTSSAGRLFDAVSALLGVCSYNSYEGQCAIELEKAASEYYRSGESLFKMTVDVDEKGYVVADQLGLFNEIKKCYYTNEHSPEEIAYAFHEALALGITKACCIIRNSYGENKVCLSGGVFNNRLLLYLCDKYLSDKGFDVYWNRLVPSGDGGLSLGQAYYMLTK